MTLRDRTSENNLCLSHQKDLQELSLNDLTVNEIVKDSIIWLKIVSVPASLLLTVVLVCEDKNNKAVIVDLVRYLERGTSFNKLCEKFPRGATIGIK